MQTKNQKRKYVVNQLNRWNIVLNNNNQALYIINYCGNKHLGVPFQNKRPGAKQTWNVGGCISQSIAVCFRKTSQITNLLYIYKYEFWGCEKRSLAGCVIIALNHMSIKG